MVPLRRLASLEVRRSFESRPTLNLEDIESGTGRVIGKLALSEGDQLIRFDRGQVLFSRLRPYLAKSVLVESPMHGTGELLPIRTGPLLNERYLLLVTLSRRWIDWAVANSYGAKMPRTSWDALADFEVPLLALDEQEALVERLESRLRAAREVRQLAESIAARATAGISGLIGNEIFGAPPAR
jgi:hypothetical protein